MANITAVGNGNWNTVGTWDAGVPQAGDTVYLAGFTIALDTDTAALTAIYSGTSGTPAGAGNITVNLTTASRTITATTLQAGTASLIGVSGDTNTLTVSCTTLTGGSASDVRGLSNYSTGTVTVTGNITGGSASYACGFLNGSTGTVNVTGNITGGTASNTYGFWNNSTGIVTIIGDITGGSGGTYAYGLLNNSTGTVTVTGNITGGSASYACGFPNNSTGTVTVLGNITGGTVETTAYGFLNDSTARVYRQGTLTDSTAVAWYGTTTSIAIIFSPNATYWIASSTNPDNLDLYLNGVLVGKDTVLGKTLYGSLVVDTTTLVVNNWAYEDKVGIGTATPVTLTEIQGGLTTTGAILTLSSKETSTVADDILGRINFRAALDTAGTDAILTGASIAAIAENTFSASVNETGLKFSTGASEEAVERIRIDHHGNVGIGETAPETLLELTSTVSYLTLHNSTHEDTAGGRESRIIAKGEQSGGEETTLGYMEFAHDGAADDEKGYFKLYTNDGDDGAAPTLRITVDSAGLLTHTGPALFQNLVDSTTAFQILDADGGTPVFNVDSTNERVGIGQAAPTAALHLSSGGMVIDSTIATGLDMSGGTFATAVQNWPATPVINVAGVRNIKIDSVNANLFIGKNSFITTDGQYNVGIGDRTGYANSTVGAGNEGDYNVYIGYSAGYGATTTNTGYENVNIGIFSGFNNTSGWGNAYVGAYTGEEVTTGYINTFIGSNAGRKTTTGHGNFFLGYASGYKNTTGYDNTFIGIYCGFNNLTGHDNLYIGYNTAFDATTAYENTILCGYAAGEHLTEGCRNIFVGNYSGRFTTTGTDNVFIGYASGYNQTTNSNLLIIDNQARGGVGAPTDSTLALIYGVFAAAAANQTIAFNAATFTINGGTDTDITMNFTGTTKSGVLKWMEDEDYFEVVDDVVMDQDTFWIGDGSGLPYGSCSSGGAHLAWSQVNPVQNTWYDISDADMVDGQLNLVTHDSNGQLTVTKAGRYLINYSMCLESTVANKHWETAISVSGTESTQGTAHYENKAISQEFTVASTAILDLAASATINLSVRVLDAGNVTVTVDCMELTVVMVGGT